MLAGLQSIGGFVIGGATGGSFEVSVSPTSVTRNSGSRGPPRTLTTAIVTVTASGGAGGNAYSWTRTSGDAAIVADSPGADATTFTATLNVGDSFAAEFVCTVTDAAGAVLATEPVSVTMSLTEIDFPHSLDPPL
jgi:hypothetical protein